MVKRTYIIAFSLCFAGILSAQSGGKISAKKEELSSLKSEIQQLERKLQSTSKRERNSITSLENLKNQELLISKLITRLDREEGQITQNIKRLNSEIVNLNNRIESIKDNYAKYIVWLYKHGKESKLKAILNAKDFQSARIRYKFLDYITEKNSNVLEKLNNSRDSLNSLTLRLNSNLERKQAVESEKLAEQKQLKSKQSAKSKLIKNLRKNKRSITQEIDQKQKAARVIQKLIDRLIAEELTRASENKQIVYDNFQNFAELKGKMPWPVSGRIIRKFGRNKNPKLKTVTMNYGIDLKSKKQSKIICVAEGIVSAVDYIAGYGSVVIVTHKDRYRSVYGQVQNLRVGEGDRVNGGDIIGTVSEGIEGSVFHFEIWKGRTNQNPSSWLARK